MFLQKKCIDFDLEKVSDTILVKLTAAGTYNRDLN